MTDFLETILPTSGLYCVVGISDGRVRQTFFDNLSEAHAQIQTLNNTGIDAYFALATFTESSRKAEYASALRSLFLDIDCGPGKPYADQAAAIDALRTFVKATKFPSPYVVLSGGGLHVYWPFTHEVPTDRWLPAAKSLKALCVEHGLGIDLTVTADAARILRAPGTNNYKEETPRPVCIGRKGLPTAFEALVKLLPAPAIDLSAARAFGVDATTQALARSELDPCSFERIVTRSRAGTGCAQMLHAVDNGSTLEEPLWRGALSIAWNCEDGQTAIHEVSKSHPEYTFEDTVEKADRLTAKPYTCEWYRLNSPNICKGCKQNVTSPIVLGRYTPEAPKLDDGSYITQVEILTPNTGSSQFVDVTIPPLPWPYFRGANGGIYAPGKTEGEEVEVYPHDLYVTERFYDSDESGDGEGELVDINVRLPRDGLRRFTAPVTSIMTTDKLRDLVVKHGVIIFGRKVHDVMSYLAAAIQKLQGATASNRTRNQMGWTSENSFVVGELEYTPAGVKLAPPASGTKQMAPMFHQRGTLDEWKQVINFYGRFGMELHAFAFFCGAGSMLLQLLNNPQVRGGVVNLVSNASGTGKTTVQMAINSLFGSPAELLMTQRDTINAKFHTLGMLNSICMTVDEITNETPENLSALVYGATTGRAQHRMEAQSNKLRTNRTTWCTIMVTSSNAVVSESLRSHKVSADGELKRIIDLHMPTPRGIAKEESDALFGKLAGNYGLAGPILVQHVVANRDAVTAALLETQVMLDSQYAFERSDRFYSSMFTCAVVAGRILQRLGLHDIDLQRVFDAAASEILTIKESNSDGSGDMSTMVLETLSSFITTNTANTLVINSEAANGAANEMPRGPLRMRYEPDTQELVIIASELRKFFVDRRVDFKTSMELLAARKVLKRGKDGGLTVTRRPAAGAHGALKGAPTRCYVMDAEVLGVQKLRDDAPKDDDDSTTFEFE